MMNFEIGFKKRTSDNFDYVMTDRLWWLQQYVFDMNNFRGDEIYDFWIFWWTKFDTNFEFVCFTTNEFSNLIIILNCSFFLKGQHTFSISIVTFLQKLDNPKNIFVTTKTSLQTDKTKQIMADGVTTILFSSQPKVINVIDKHLIFDFSAA